jgi:phosphoribosyl-ATP pyrophosphohydrolase/phosphoribosyl-AMP cyclohydrolase
MIVPALSHRDMANRQDAERLARTGEIALIVPNDAGEADTRALALCRLVPCRVGEALQCVETARAYLRAGAARVVIAESATRSYEATTLPRNRVIVALQRPFYDAPARAADLASRWSGFFLEGSDEDLGTMIAVATAIRSLVSEPVTIGRTAATIAEIVECDRRGIDLQIPLDATHAVRFCIAAFCGCANFERANGLIPTVVCDAGDGVVRMLAYSSPASLEAALTEGAGIFWSRRRKRLWRKGESSGCVQELVRAELDCDRDALVFHVRQHGATCHTGSERCFGSRPFRWETLERRIAERASSSPRASYTARLLAEPDLLAAKLREEVEELIRAERSDEVAWEGADLLYFLTVRLRQAGVTTRDVLAQLASRAV